MNNQLSITADCLYLRGEWASEQVARHWPTLSACQLKQLELSQLKRIDSAGIAAIITALKPEPSNRLLIKHCPEQAKQLFKLYELEALLQYHD